MRSLKLRFFKFLGFAWGLTLLQIPSLLADATGFYPEAAFFDVVPDSLSAFVDINEISGVVVPLVSDFQDDSFGLVEAQAEIDENTAPSLPAGRTPATMNETAIGVASTEETLENSAAVSGVFDEDIGKRYAITAGSSQTFTIEFIPGAVTGTTAVICLMPIRLAIFEGTTLVGPATAASASYAYSLAIDGSTIFESSMRLSGTQTNQELTTVAGTQRTDGVFFTDATIGAFGIDFPAITITADMGDFEDGFTRDGQIDFTMTLEAPDNDWGGFAAPNVNGGTNIFIPIPEPQLPGLLAAAGLLLVLRRRAS